MNIIKNNTAYIITVLSVFFNLLFFWSGGYDYLEQKLYDYRLRLRGPLSGDYISSSSKYQNIKDNKAIKYDYTNDNDVIKGISFYVNVIKAVITIQDCFRQWNRNRNLNCALCRTTTHPLQRASLVRYRLNPSVNSNN